MKKIISLLLILFIVTGCNKNDVINPEIDNNKEIENNQVVESQTFINTNSKYQEEKVVDDLVFSNASLVKKDNDCLFEVTVKNQNQTIYNFEYVKITLLDNSNNPIIELNGLVTNGTLEVSEEKVISAYYNGDIAKVYDVKYEIVR